MEALLYENTISMNLPLIAQANAKGQVVIPKTIREKLGITEGTLLSMILRDEGVYLFPAKKANISKQNLLKVLEQTRGAWGPASPEELEREKKQHQVEIEASKRRRQAW